MRLSIASIMSVLLAGCVGVPEGVSPVAGFDAGRYMGKWYEIARLDHSFERGLDHVSAEYSHLDGGGVKVVNRGFSSASGKWSEVVGKAYFVGEPCLGHLKVSFFWPFYGSYIVFGLDDEYRHAYVCGPDKSYLWLLARTPTVGAEVVAEFVSISESLGFDTGRLLFVNQQ